MAETTWKLTLKDGASSPAKRAHRAVAELVRVMRDLRDVAPQASRAMEGFGGASTVRNLRTQIGLTRELGREMRRNSTAGRRGGRGNGYYATANMRQIERADAAQGQRASRRMQSSFRENDRLRRQSQAREGRESERHYRGIYASQQRARAWGDRQNARATSQQQRAEARRAQALAGPTGMGAMLAGGASVLLRGIAGIVTATLSAITAIAGLAAGFGALSLMIGGALLRLISFRESTLMTLSTLMRVDGEDRMSPQQRQNARGTAARGEFRWAQQFGRETPLSTQQVVELRTQAATAGYQGAEARTMTGAAADAGALHPHDEGTARRFMLQMGQLRNSAVARAADYRPASQAAGVSEMAVMRRARTGAQRQGEADDAYQRRIDENHGHGAITGRQMHDAILAEQRHQTGSRNSGDFARSQSGSIGAVLSNLGEGFDAFVTSIEDIERLPGVQMLKAMLTDITAMLAGTTNNGKALQAIFAQLTNEAASFVGNIFGKGGFDGFLSSAMDTVKELLPPLRAIWQGFSGGFMEGFMPFIRGLGGLSDLTGTLREIGPEARELGRGFASIAVFALQITGAVFRLGGALVRFFPTLVRWVNALASAGEYVGILNRVLLNPGQIIGDITGALIRGSMGGGAVADAAANAASARVAGQFQGIGADMGRGVAAGFRSQQGFMQSEISSVMGSLPTQARTDMQIKSPSRVMAEIGEHMADGVTVGLDSGAGGVQSAMSNVVAPPSLPGFGGGLGGMGGVNVGGVTIMVNGAQDTAGVVEELRTKLEEFLVGLIERPALAGGG